MHPTTAIQSHRLKNTDSFNPSDLAKTTPFGRSHLFSGF
ncbi:hypothetical protein EOK76_g2068 [Lacticaseibacillus paracasei]|nr:hypothetical protein EOK76_g2068 [Lacticaseibacillus paracasei]